MTRNDLSRVFGCCRRHQSSICVRLGIVITVCFLLCTVCFLVERRRSPGQTQTPISDVYHSSEKLIQIRHHGLYDESTQTAFDVNLQGAFNNFNNNNNNNDDDDEGSGYFQEVPVMAHYEIRPRHGGDYHHIPKSVQLDNDEFDMMAATTNFHNGPRDVDAAGIDSDVGASETSHRLGDFDPEADLYMGKSSIEKIFDNLPRFSELEAPSSQRGETTAAPASNMADSLDSEDLDDDEKIVITIKDLGRHQLPAKSIDSSERFFSEELLDLARAMSAEDDTFDENEDDDDDFILTNFDNGDYMQLKTVDPPAKKVLDRAPLPTAAPPSLFDSFFGRMNNLLSKQASFRVDPARRFPFQTPQHLSNFKDSPLRHDHLVQESANAAPVHTTRPHSDAAAAVPLMQSAAALRPATVNNQQQWPPMPADRWFRLFGAPRPKSDPKTRHTPFNVFGNWLHK